jgi:hypothetical protein
MGYKLVGIIVVKGAKLFLRRRYGPTYTPKPLIAIGVVGAAIGIAVLASKRDALHQ